jgi:hypothetical protein
MAWGHSHQIQAPVREVDRHGADSENGPFLKLSTLAAIQAVKDGVDEENVPVETGGGRKMSNKGFSRGKPHPDQEWWQEIGNQE